MQTPVVYTEGRGGRFTCYVSDGFFNCSGSFAFLFIMAISPIDVSLEYRASYEISGSSLKRGPHLFSSLATVF
jgi:hypothetical protein